MNLFDVSAVDMKKKNTQEKSRHIDVSFNKAKCPVNYMMNNDAQTFLNQVGLGVGSKDV